MAKKIVEQRKGRCLIRKKVVDQSCQIDQIEAGVTLVRVEEDRSLDVIGLARKRALQRGKHKYYLALEQRVVEGQLRPI